MKRLYFIIFVVLCSYAMGQETYFVSDGIVYNITSESEQTVEVAFYQFLLDNPYSGAITIPPSVVHDGTTYTVTALGRSAFEGCTGVTSLTLPATVRSFGSYCFYDCNFASLQMPDSLKHIGDHAFLYSNISTLHLPAGFEGYGDAAFWAKNLTSIAVDEANAHYRSIDGCLYSKDSLTLCIVPSGKTGTITVPSFVRHIGRQAFGFNSRATSVSLPEGLTSIGDFAFNVCHTVNNIVIPSTVTHIGLCPFSYCPQLTNLTIASGNTHYVMDGLMIYSAGFDTLVSCHKSGANVTLNPNVRVVGGFENNTWVRNIDMPAEVTDILDNCFNGCSFSDITLPANMKRIGALAFANNNALNSVTINSQLDTIGEAVFQNGWLEYIRFAVGNPPAVKGSGPLEETGNVGTIYIPCGADATWWTDSYWSQFADKYREDCGAINRSENSAISIYPNPATARLTIALAGGESIIELINSKGQTILLQKAIGKQAEIDVSRLPRGVYFLRINSSEGTHTQKVILK